MRLVSSALIILVISACVRADDSSTVAAKKGAGCKTPLDLIASQNPNLPMHPVFQEILNSPALKGTFFVPTATAWDNFFATVRQRQGNPEAPAMVARYGQVMLYHIAQDVDVPIATPTPGANKFAFDTASTLQCSVGPGLPNNRVVVKKTPQAILLQHGTGNATIVSQPISYCGGEAFLVDQVLLPCSDVSAIMGEIANVPSPCKNNVEGVLQRNGLSYYNALLLATGVNRPIFASVRNFTIFAPTDAAIQDAYESGALDYPEMFATRKPFLAGVVAYHTVAQVALTAPGAPTLTMSTMLTDQGKASCANPALSWRPDGFIYGGAGAAKVSGTYDRGCAAVIFQIDSLLQPCCKPMAELLGGMRAVKGSMTYRAISFLKAQLKATSGVHSTFVLPTESAWQALMDEAQSTANSTLTDAQLGALVSYLYTGAEVADVIDDATPVKTALSLSPKDIKAICPRPSNASLVFAYDQGTPAAATADTPSIASAVDVTPAPAAVPAVDLAPDSAGAAPASPADRAAGPGLVQATTSTTLTAGSGYPTTTTAPTVGVPPVGAAAIPGTGTASLLTGARRLAQTKLPTSADSLLLPTTFSSSAARKKKGAAIVAGPVMLVDGAAMDMRLPAGIAVSSITYGCDGAIYHVNAVPLPCNFLGRKAAVKPAVAAPKPAPLPMTISAALVNTTNIPGAVPNTTKPTASTASSATPALASGAVAVLLAAMLL